MMKSGTRFLQGLSVGVVLSLSLIAFLVHRPVIESPIIHDVSHWQQTWRWVYANLGMSIPVFVMLTGLFFATLSKLRSALQHGAPAERVAQLDHLLDTWTSLFFGVGVIWTAIGMRSALVFALGEPDLTLSQGAYAILEKMVEGGILLALSTTIVGGIGGYLLRVIKTLTVEAEIKRYYDQLQREPGLEIQSTLDAIERHLRQLATPMRS